MNSPKQGVSNLPEICFRHGMRRVVIAPGSRNAPLIFAFTGHGKLECLSIADERSAAYFALGLALFFITFVVLALAKWMLIRMEKNQGVKT